MSNLEQLESVLNNKKSNDSYYYCIAEDNKLHLRASYNIENKKPISKAQALREMESWRSILEDYGVDFPTEVSIRHEYKIGEEYQTDIDALLDTSRIDMERVRAEYSPLRENALKRIADKHIDFMVNELKDWEIPPKETAQVLARIIHRVRNQLHPSKPAKDAVTSALMTRLTSTDRGGEQTR